MTFFESSLAQHLKAISEATHLCLQFSSEYYSTQKKKVYFTGFAARPGHTKPENIYDCADRPSDGIIALVSPHDYFVY
jgi:hypothetical protein